MSLMQDSGVVGELRHARFNTIYVIESLPRGESRTGKELHQHLKHLGFQVDGLQSRYEEVNSRKAFVKLLHRVQQEIGKARIPFLHLEIHGNAKGLSFANGDDIEWEALHQHLRRLNVATQNNLVVSFAACRAAGTYFDIDPMMPAPFLGVIAPLANVSVEEVEEGFPAFFVELFRSFDLPAAVDALNQVASTPKFQLLHAEGFFEMLWGMLEGMYTNPVTYQQRIRETMSTALHSRSIRHSYSLPELRFEIEKFFNPAGRVAMKEHYRRVFLMLNHDLVP